MDVAGLTACMEALMTAKSILVNGAEKNHLPGSTAATAFICEFAADKYDESASEIPTLLRKLFGCGLHLACIVCAGTGHVLK